MFKSRSRQRIFRCRLQCQINVNLANENPMVLLNFKHIKIAQVITETRMFLLYYKNKYDMIG